MSNLSDTEPVVAAQPHPVESAKAAGLHYVSDLSAGIRRKRAGKGFVYFHENGKRITDDEEMARIRALAVPPAWTDVWICPDPDGHIQATGRDDRGRKQYRYHPRWVEVRDQTKFDKLIAFAHALPLIRERVEKDLARSGLPREKILATVVKLLEKTFIRVGNDEYASQNDSYGLTTLKDKHVKVDGARMRFQFRGKSGIEHAISLEDRHLARIVSHCQELPGEELFQYVDDDGSVRGIGSADVNEYLREITGQDITAKDFRTWAGTVMASIALRQQEPPTSQRHAKRQITQALDIVAHLLGNTRAVCRKCYIHPAILDCYCSGTLVSSLRPGSNGKANGNGSSLRPEEKAVLALLEKRQENN